MIARRILLGWALVLPLLATASPAVEVGIFLDEGTPGAPVKVELVVFYEGIATANLEAVLSFAAPLRIVANEDGTPRCQTDEFEPSVTGTFEFLPSGCAAEACTGVQIATSAMPAFSRNVVVASCMVHVESGTEPGFYELPLTDVVVTDADGVSATPRKVFSDGVSVPELPRRATIVIGSAEGRLGETVDLDVFLETTIAARIERVGMNIIIDPLTNIPFDEDTRRAFCEINPEIRKDESLFVGNPFGGVAARIFGTTQLIPSGARLFTCPIKISDNARLGVHRPFCLSASAYETREGFIATDCASGFLTVLPGLPGTPTVTPTPTPTRTPSPTPTRRPSTESGCSIPVEPSGSAGALVLLLVALPLWRRRTRDLRRP